MNEHFEYASSSHSHPAETELHHDSFLQIRARSSDEGPLESHFDMNNDTHEQLDPVVQIEPYPFSSEEPQVHGRNASYESLTSLNAKHLPHYIESSAGEPSQSGLKRNDSLFSATSISDLNHSRFHQNELESPLEASGPAQMEAPTADAQKNVRFDTPSTSRSSSQTKHSVPSVPALPDSGPESAQPSKKQTSPPEKSSGGKRRGKWEFLSVYRYLPPGGRIKLLFPALLVSILRGLATPVMTKLLGKVANDMSKFNGRASDAALNAVQPPLSPAQRAAIRHAAGAELNDSTRVVCIIFAAIALAVIILGVVGTVLWLKSGEHVGQSLRLLSFDALTRKPMSWYDGETTCLLNEKENGGKKSKEEKSSSDSSKNMGPAGAGGMMTRFVRYVFPGPQTCDHEHWWLTNWILITGTRTKYDWLRVRRWGKPSKRAPPSSPAWQLR